jgi:hypothetical protein
MIESAVLPHILVYSILLFAAFVLVRQVLKFLKGDVRCEGCSDRCCLQSSGSNCPQHFDDRRTHLPSCPPEEQAKKELKVIRMPK